MGAIWSDKNKFDKWLEFEVLACEALAEQETHMVYAKLMRS